MKALEMTREEVATLSKYMNERAIENWGMWPSPNDWPIADRFGAFSVLQYGTGKCAVVKFDNLIKLPDGRMTKKVGVGNVRKLNGVTSI